MQSVRAAPVRPERPDPQHELSLLLRWRSGDAVALQSLCSAYAAAIASVVRRWCRGHLQRLDLIQEGQLALIEAFDRYDPATRVPLFQYAMKRVEGCIKRFVMNFSGPCRPTTDADRAAFFSGGGPEAVAIDDVEIGSDAPSPEDLVLNGDTERHRRAVALRLLRRLSGREREIVRRRIMSDSPEMLSDIAARRGISRQTAHETERRAMRKLRQALPAVAGPRLAWIA